MSKNEQLRKLIEAMVRAEVRKLVPALVKESLSQVMGQLIMEAEITAPAPVSIKGNSEKRRKLIETVDIEEDEPVTSIPSRRPRAPVSWDGEPPFTGDVGLSYAIGASGNPIPISPDAVPEQVVNAINKDYSALMKTLKLAK